MSATTVLVPVSEDEVRRLLTGQRVEALGPRARLLRSRVAQVDAVREDVHSALYEGWENEQAAALPRPGLLAALGRRIKPPPVDGRLPTGYDPYIHIFGRSLPVAADAPVAVAERLAKLLAMDDAAFATAINDDLRQLGAGAFTVSAQAKPVEVEASLLQQLGALATALQAQPPQVRAAWDAVLRISAWSRPVWRLDGDLLSPFLTLLAVGTKPEPATELFKASGLDLAGAQALPAAIPSFSGGGGYFSVVAVKALAAALRFQSRLVQTAQKTSDDPEVALRNLRLLSEAAFYCEREGLGLAEAAGVEWHDRPEVAPPSRAP